MAQPRELVPGVIEINHKPAEALQREFKESIGVMHRTLADIPPDREKAVRHAKRLSGYGEDSSLPRNLADLSMLMLNIYKLSLEVPPGYYLELEVPPKRAYARDLQGSGYVRDLPTTDTTRHYINVGLVHQEDDRLKQLVLDFELPNNGFPLFILREVINNNRGRDRVLQADDLLGVRVRFPTR